MPDWAGFVAPVPPLPVPEEPVLEEPVLEEPVLDPPLPEPPVLEPLLPPTGAFLLPAALRSRCAFSCIVIIDAANFLMLALVERSPAKRLVSSSNALPLAAACTNHSSKLRVLAEPDCANTPSPNPAAIAVPKITVTVFIVHLEP